MLKKWHRVERLVFPVPSVAFDGEDGGLQLCGSIQRKVVKVLFPVDGIQISVSLEDAVKERVVLVIGNLQLQDPCSVPDLVI